MTQLEKAIVSAVAIQPTVWMPFLVKAAEAGMKEMTWQYDFMFHLTAYHANMRSIIRFWSVLLEV